jgi:hypothetical protein
MQRAMDIGVGYLRERQHRDGHWEDFDLPVGRSDAWVTAYVGLAMATVGRIGERAGASAVATGAARWLSRNRPYKAGWGYNGVTGPDSDSTAYALRLLRATGLPIRADDEAWLLGNWQPTGGFATYHRSDGWGIAHPDVTPVAFRALPDDQQRHLRPALIRYLLRSQDTDGTWPAYWWRTRHYSTFQNGSLARELQLPNMRLSMVVTFEESRMVHSALDLVFVTAIATLTQGWSSLTRALSCEVLERQRKAGYWDGARNLRVMHHDAADPWSHPYGHLYADTDHLFTTASAVWLLATLIPTQIGS